MYGPFKITQSPTFLIAGYVIENGSGLSGVNINITGEGIDNNVTTIENGTYIMWGLVNGTYTVTPSKDGYTFNPDSIPVTINNTDVDLDDIIASDIGTTYIISGLVLENDDGLGGVSVRITGEGIDRTILTDADGMYEIEGLSRVGIIPFRIKRPDTHSSVPAWRFS